MPTIQELVGARIRELRKARGWTLEDLAEKAQKHYTYIGGLERGDRNVTLEVLQAVASALHVPIKSLFNIAPHPLETKLNATSDDILSAIQKGFRAIIDAKGKLAEYFLNRELDELEKNGSICDLVWYGRDGEPDFTFRFHGKLLRLECKNVRSPDAKRKNDWVRAELQKTRNSKDGTPTRAYRADQFEILSVCLFNRTGEWKYLHISVHGLVRREEFPDLLEIMQTVPQVEPYGHWRQSLIDAFSDYENRSQAS
ncbi:MAG TPA: helix-turn-helix domain-containing protein [Verrucomicrobiae bacterium]|nr:helix-turn-helix domain-containing protein [Verrucomicrobiae bacterium]